MVHGDRVGAMFFSPVQAWLFYFALVLFPLWWLGTAWHVLQKRVIGGTDTEKVVPLDDPQIEFGMCLIFGRCPIMCSPDVDGVEHGASALVADGVRLAVVLREGVCFDRIWEVMSTSEPQT
jgi:hypothetical protein